MLDYKYARHTMPVLLYGAPHICSTTEQKVCSTGYELRKNA